MKLHQIAISVVIGMVLTVPFPSSATDWYWINDFGGTWDQDLGGVTSWKDPVENFGIPGEGDNAFLVLPYSLSFCPSGETWADGNCITQTVPVTYRSDTDPDPNPVLNQLVIESQNLLHQRATTPNDHNNLTSNVEIIGGSGLTFNPPSSFFLADPPGIFPVGRHRQDAGNNTVHSLLTLGGIEGSFGTYELGGTGILHVGFLEKIGREGNGQFIQTGGSHTLDEILIMGESSPGVGTYDLSDGSLDVGNQEIIGSSGSGTFNQSGGTHTTGVMVLGAQSNGVGVYEMTDGTLNASSSVTVGRDGVGTFNQSDGVATFGSLILGSQGTSPTERGDGTYNLEGGTLTVNGVTRVGRDGKGLFIHSGGEHRTQGLTLSENAFGEGTYQLEDGTLEVVGSEIIGGSGFTGSFLHTYGEHIVTGDGVALGQLVLGQHTATGYYELVHGGDLFKPATLVTDNLTVGSSELGLFTQNGSTSTTFVTVNNELSIAEFAGSGNSVYELIDGRLTVTGQVVVGKGAYGEFIQHVGDVLLDELILGGSNVGEGFYSLAGGSLDVFGREVMGDSGRGSFEQNAGVHHVYSDLIMAETDRGTTVGLDADYVFRSGSLQVDGDTVIGAGGVAEIIHTGNASHQVAGDLVLGNLATGDGTYIMRSGTPELDVTGNLVVGRDASSKAKFSLEAGTVNVTGSTLIGVNRVEGIVTDTFVQDGGVLNTGRLIVNNNNPQIAVNFFVGYVLNDGVLTVSTDEIIGSAGNATFTQNGGTHHAQSLRVGTDQDLGGATARFDLRGGTLEVDRDLVIGSAQSEPHAVFIQGITGSPLATVSRNVLIGATGDLRGTYDMFNGILNVHGNIHVGGSSAPGGEFLDSRLIIRERAGATAGVTSGLGRVFVAGNGDVDLRGGFLNGIITPAVTSARGITANVEQTDEAVINDGRISFSGPPTGRISGGIYSNGIIEVTATTAQIDDRLVNNGQLNSSGSATTLLEELIVNTSGWITTEAGDQFIISGNFANHSEQDTLWDTDIASLVLNSGASQDMYLPGMDFGDILQGYTDNFSWGELHIASGTTLNLFDGNTTPGAGLYVGLFDLADGVDLNTLLISSITSDYNIYYNPMLAGNDYLGGMTFALNGAGFLTPSVPIPPAVWLFGSGLIGLIAIARRRA